MHRDVAEQGLFDSQKMGILEMLVVRARTSHPTHDLRGYFTCRLSRNPLYVVDS